MGEIMILKDIVRKANIQLIGVSKKKRKRMGSNQYLKILRIFRIEKDICPHIKKCNKTAAG